MNRIISELSCETKDWKFSFAATGINYMHLNIQNGNNNDFITVTVYCYWLLFYFYQKLEP